MRRARILGTAPVSLLLRTKLPTVSNVLWILALCSNERFRGISVNADLREVALRKGAAMSDTASKMRQGPRPGSDHEMKLIIWTV